MYEIGYLEFGIFRGAWDLVLRVSFLISILSHFIIYYNIS